MMKRFIILVIVSLIVLSACGTRGNNAQTSTIKPEEVETFDYQFTDKGLELTADIEVENEITVNATIKNITDKTIVYNGRCGIPFYITIQMDGANAYLATKGDGEIIECEDIFAPEDLEDLEAGDSFEKTVTFAREFAFFNRDNTPLHEGDYHLQFGFTTFDSGHFYTEYPLYLTSQVEPEILTLEEAINLGTEHEDFVKWKEEQEEKGLEVKTERGLLTDDEWVLGLHSLDEQLVNRIIVAINHRSGDVTRIDYESFQLEEGMEQFLEDL